MLSSGKNWRKLRAYVDKVMARDHDVVGNVMHCDRTSNQQWWARIVKTCYLINRGTGAKNPAKTVRNVRSQVKGR